MRACVLPVRVKFAATPATKRSIVPCVVRAWSKLEEFMCKMHRSFFAKMSEGVPAKHTLVIELDDVPTVVSRVPTNALSSAVGLHAYFSDIHIVPRRGYMPAVLCRELAEHCAAQIAELTRVGVRVETHASSSEIIHTTVDSLCAIFVPPDLEFDAPSLQALEETMRQRAGYGSRFAVESVYYVDPILRWSWLPIHGLLLVLAVIDFYAGLVFPAMRHDRNSMRARLLVSTYFKRRTLAPAGCCCTVFGLGWCLRNRTTPPIQSPGNCVADPTPRVTFSLTWLVAYLVQLATCVSLMYYVVAGGNFTLMGSAAPQSLFLRAGVALWLYAAAYYVAVRRIMFSRGVYAHVLVLLYPVWVALSPLLLLVSAT